MRRVINKEEYKDNWIQLREAVAFICLDSAIAIGLFALMLIAIIPACILCALGYAPKVEHNE